MMARKKSRLVIIAVMALVIVVSASVGVTMSILVTNTSGKSKVFTFGNAGINVVEENWNRLSDDDKIVYPGRTVPKDPKITNTGSTELYAYLKVKIPSANIRVVNNDETVADASKHNLFSFETNSDWTLLDTDDSNDDYEVRLYAYTKGALAPGSSTNTLFDEVTFVNMLEGEIDMGTKLEIITSGYAIQSDLAGGAEMTAEKYKELFDQCTA